MKKYSYVIPGTTASVKHYLPIPDAGKIVGLYAAVNSAQTAGTAVVKVGKKSATNVLMTADLGTTGANGIGNIAKAAANASATAAEKAQIFNYEVPVELDIQLVVAGSVGVTLLVDEYAIS